MTELLQVGDVLFQYHRYGKGVDKYTVERVTNTQAIIKGSHLKAKREIITSISNEKYVNCIGVGNYEQFHLYTEKLENRYKWWQLRKQVHLVIQSLKFDDLTIEQLQSLYDVLSTFKLSDGSE